MTTGVQLGGFRLPRPRVRQRDRGSELRDRDMVFAWTAEDEIALARRVVAQQEKKKEGS